MSERSQWKYDCGVILFVRRNIISQYQWLIHAVITQRNCLSMFGVTKQFVQAHLPYFKLSIPKHFSSLVNNLHTHRIVKYIQDLCAKNFGSELCEYLGLRVGQLKTWSKSSKSLLSCYFSVSDSNPLLVSSVAGLFCPWYHFYIIYDNPLWWNILEFRMF